MKTKVTPELLASYLADLESGRLSVEECASVHPSLADDLRSLLDIATAIDPLPPVTPDPVFRLQGRAALIRTISTEKRPVTKSSFQRFTGLISGGWSQPLQSFVGRMGMPALIVALVVAIITAAGGGAVYASQDTVPGDALYGVKTAVEAVQLAIASTDEAKAQTYLELAEKRLEELEKSSSTSNVAAANMSAESFTQDVTQAEQYLSEAAASGKDVSSLAAQLADNLARQQKALASVQQRVPEQAQEALTRAAKAAEKGLTAASARLPGTSDNGKPAGGKPNPVTSTVELADPVGAPITGTEVSKHLVDISGTVSVSLTQTMSAVQKLATDHSVPGQSFDGLLAKLQSAKEALERGQAEVAARILDAFLGELNALQNSGHISDDDYNALYNGYRDLITGIGGTPKAQENGDSAATGSKKPEPSSTPVASSVAHPPSTISTPSAIATPADAPSGGPAAAHTPARGRP